MDLDTMVLPINHIEENLTVRVLKGDHEEYDMSEKHRHIVIRYIGTDLNVSEIWYIEDMRISPYGIDIKLTKKKRTSEVVRT